MATEVQDLNLLATAIFQNVTVLSPLLKDAVLQAKQFQKSVQGTSNLAIAFIESLNNLAQGALAAQGATTNIGDVLVDVIEVYKELENMRVDLMKLFISEVIIPLESKAEQQIQTVRVAQKGYSRDNKFQAEVAEKAKNELVKARKKSQRRKSISNSTRGKYETREKEMIQNLEESEAKLKEIREHGLRKALIEERRIYCFVAERMCIYGRGLAAYTSRISTLVSQKTTEWQSVINKPAELPPESEEIIKNPSSYNNLTIRKKPTRSKSRASSFSGSSTKYHTFDGRVKSGNFKQAISCPESQTLFKPPSAPPDDIINGEDNKTEKSIDRKIPEANIRMSFQPAQTVKQITANQKTRLRALYDHTGQDSSQISFNKGDLLNPICEPTSGWQYGENISTETTGWFPAAYTESVLVAPVGKDMNSTMPVHGSSLTRVSLTSPEEERTRRFSTPAQRAPFLPEPDYDDTFLASTSPIDEDDSMAGFKAIHDSTSSPDMRSEQSKRIVGNMPNLDALTAEIKKLQQVEENIEMTSHNCENGYTAMPPPPPPPPFDENDVDNYKHREDNPFSSVRLKKTDRLRSHEDPN